MELIQQHLSNVNHYKFATFCNNGNEALDRTVDKIDNDYKQAQKLLAQNENSRAIIQPVKLVISDFKMPMLGGLNLLKEIKAHIRKLNKLSEEIKVYPPKFVLTSALVSPEMRCDLENKYKC